MFTDMVNATDEALVMLVAKCYFPRWDKGEEMGKDDGSEEGTVGSKHSGGAEKGERLTCSRTARTFYDYCRKVSAARQSPFKEMWDARLQGEVIKQLQDEMEHEDKREKEAGKITGKVGGDSNDADMMNGCFGGCFGVDELQTTATPV